MKNINSVEPSKARLPEHDYDIDFDFRLTFSLTDYLLISLYLVCLLPIELATRIVTDCLGAYRERKSRHEAMRPLLLE